jgi:phage gp46-like protein
MPDIRLVPIATPDVVTWDWLQTPAGLLDETNELITAVLVAFNSDAVAAPSDVLPDPRSDDRRGWWGDMDAPTIWNGWPLGSKLWLLTRAKIVDQNAAEGATVTRVQQYLQQCLQPFVTARICSAFNVVVWKARDRNDRILARVTIYRGPKSAIALEFEPLWTELFPASKANV